jgi:uncharacterized membrane protein
MPQNFYELVWIFFIYAFIGWCTEVAYAAVDRGIFVNRGFLNGPYCPIYGCGVVIVVAVLTPLKENLFILFAGSFLLTSLLEFVTGFLLEKVFHNKWWDYSDKPFNIKGYVCLKFSIYWGLACTFVMDIIHPVIYKGIIMMPHTIGVVVISLFMTVFFVDCGITVSTILKFNKRLKVMDEMAAQIHKISDEIGENIFENVSGAIEKSEEFQENHAELIDKLSDTREELKELPEATKEKLAESTQATREKLAESTQATREKLAESTQAAREKITESTQVAKERITESVEERKREHIENSEARRQERIAYIEEKKRERAELTEKYQRLMQEKNSGFRRLIKAFPEMKSRDQNETLQKYKEKFNIRKLTEKREENIREK